MKSKTPLIAILVTFLFCINKLNAQDKPSDAPIMKEYTNAIFLNGIKGEYYFKENSCVFYSLDYNFNKDYRYRITNSTRLYNRIGLEMNAGGRWYVGASLAHRLAYDAGLNMATVKANASHRGKIGSVQFTKELSLEYIHHFNYTYFDKYKDIQVGIGVAVYKDFTVLKRPLGIMLSYKVLINSKLQYDIYKDRKIDFTKMRADIFYGITKNLYIGLFAMRETEYYYPIGTSDASGTNIFYKVNSVNPIIGANLNIVLNSDKITKYIPGLPFR